MNAPFKPDSPVEEILADACVGISGLKKNPAAAIAEAAERPVAILNRNKPVAYLIAPHVWAHLCEMVEDAKLGEAARAALAEDGEDAEVDFGDL
jgi:antitoxin StbD